MLYISRLGAPTTGPVQPCPKPQALLLKPILLADPENLHQGEPKSPGVGDLKSCMKPLKDPWVAFFAL